MPVNLTDLQTFALVAEAGSISGAALRLKVPKSTVSRRVRRLEDALGQELLRRSSRSISLTANGRALHERSRGALSELEAAIQTLENAETEPTGVLRLTTTPSFGQSRRVLQCIDSYGRDNPGVTLDFELTNRLVSLVEEGVDVAFRLHTDKLPGSASLMTRTLLKFRRVLYASPAYVRERGLPDSPDGLANHCIAAHSAIDGGEIRWLRHGKPWGKPSPLPEPKWHVNSTATLQRLALMGAGLAFLPTIDAEENVARGELVEVLPGFSQPGATVSLVWPSSRHLAPRIRSFINHAVATLGQSG